MSQLLFQSLPSAYSSPPASFSSMSSQLLVNFFNSCLNERSAFSALRSVNKSQDSPFSPIFIQPSLNSQEESLVILILPLHFPLSLGTCTHVSLLDEPTRDFLSLQLLSQQFVSPFLNPRGERDLPKNNFLTNCFSLYISIIPHSPCHDCHAEAIDPNIVFVSLNSYVMMLAFGGHGKCKPTMNLETKCCLMFVTNMK